MATDGENPKMKGGNESFCKWPPDLDPTSGARTTYHIMILQVWLEEIKKKTTFSSTLRLEFVSRLRFVVMQAEAETKRLLTKKVTGVGLKFATV